MNCFVITHFAQIRNLNKFTLKRCLPLLTSRFFCSSNEKDKLQSNKVELKTSRRKRREEIKARFIKNFKDTKEKVEHIIERENIWTIPNFICVARILATPCLGYLILSQDYQVALYLLGFAGFSDVADGWIARTWTSQASKIGSFLDPVADKILIGTLFLTLTWVGLIPVPLTCLIVARDIALVVAASYIRYHSLPHPKTLKRYFDATHATAQLAPTFISKINTGVQLSLVAGTLAAPVFHFVDHPILQGLCYLTALTTVAGGLSYLISKNTYKMLGKKKSGSQTSDKAR